MELIAGSFVAAALTFFGHLVLVVGDHLRR